MPVNTTLRPPDDLAQQRAEPDPVAERVRAARVGLRALLREAEQARRDRAEATAGDGSGALCAWNHFENIPTFYNWNNRPR